MLWERRCALFAMTSVALALLAVSTAAANGTSVEVRPETTPDAVLVGQEVLITYTIQLEGYSHENVTSTSVYWDTSSHAGTLDKAAYPNSTNPLEGEIDGTYTASFVAPGEPTTVHYLIHAVVDGVHHYAPREYTLQVLPYPQLFVEDAPDAAFVAHYVTVTWSVQGANDTSLTTTRVYWDTKSHGPAADHTLYSKSSEEATPVGNGTYRAEFQLPEEVGTVHYVVHARVGDLDVTSEEEYQLHVRPVPGVEVTQAPEHAFSGDPVHLSWNITDALPDEVEWTSVHWDTESHASSVPDHTAYIHMSPVLPSNASGEYGVTVLMPALPGTVYYIVRARVLGGDFYSGPEGSVEVHSLPEVSLVVPAPEAAFPGSNVTVEWNVTSVPAQLVSGTWLRWDDESHANLLDHDLYSGSSRATSPGASARFAADMTVPGQEGSNVHYMIHAVILGQDFYHPYEGTLRVRYLPIIFDVDYLDRVDEGGTQHVSFAIENAEPGEVSNLTIHWDIESHEDSLDPAEYPNLVGVVPSPIPLYTTDFDVPGEPGRVHFIITGEVDGIGFDSVEEHTFRVEDRSYEPGPALIVLGVVLVLVLVYLFWPRRRRGVPISSGPEPPSSENPVPPRTPGPGMRTGTGGPASGALGPSRAHDAVSRQALASAILTSAR